MGQSAAAKALDVKTARVAVVAYVRHAETSHDSMFAQGRNRRDARLEVRPKVDAVLVQWASAA